MKYRSLLISQESERDAELQKKLEWLASSDEQNRVYYSEEYISDDDDNQDMWNVSDNRGEDLAEYLISQLVTIPLTDKEQAIAEYLIDLLDSRGYLTEETDQIAAQLETEEDEVARMLQVVQSLEPAGVGARNLSECLLIQMDRLKIWSDCALRCRGVPWNIPAEPAASDCKEAEGDCG